MSRKNVLIPLLFFLMGALILTACLPGKTETDQSDELGAVEDTIPPTDKVKTQKLTENNFQPTPTIKSTMESEEETVELNPLQAAPIPQTFQASDGTRLQGKFYPAEEIGAPVIVLLHWAIGDQEDWLAIAPWLQNRGYEPQLPSEPDPWLDPTWFPKMPEGSSFNVFTFTYRGCEGGCTNFDRKGWLLDTEAAMAHIADLENIDPTRVLTIGASIGADGAPFGCSHYPQGRIGDCVGALSLSPGGYLTIPYSQEVEALESETPPRPAWCLYSSEDGPSAKACGETSGELFLAIEYPGSTHGMALISPERSPNPMEVILDFINQYLIDSLAP